jgi:hypothetical protein
MAEPVKPSAAHRKKSSILVPAEARRVAEYETKDDIGTQVYKTATLRRFEGVGQPRIRLRALRSRPSSVDLRARLKMGNLTISGLD